MIRSISTLLFLVVVSSFSAEAQIYPKRELRAAWIASVVNIDWPSAKGISANAQREEYVRLLDTLKSAGMNAVIVQVRPVADAFYPSSYEPWSEYLSGKQGKPMQPYYNPLAFMIEEARKRGLEFHAWFNPYRASMNANLAYARDHIIGKHPEWFVEYGGKYYFDPGHPEAREFVLNSIMETVRHYDLDAVHFDDYFYPYRIANVEFPDSCTWQDHGRGRYEDVADWRRSNVDYFVEELAHRIRSERPHVKFGISPFGVWRNRDKDPLGSDTRAGQTNYDDLYADVLKWLKEGWIDYVTPQLYWPIGFAVADYSILAEWWSRNAFGKHLYIGQGVYRLGNKGWESPRELVDQIELNRTYPAIHGSMYFSAKAFLNNTLDVNATMREVYRYPALVPVMDWLEGDVPAPPAMTKVSGGVREGVTLEWRDTVATESQYYVVYRFVPDEPVNLEDATRIRAIVQRQAYPTQHWTDRDVRSRRYVYLVTAVSRLHRESAGSVPVGVKVSRKKVRF